MKFYSGITLASERAKYLNRKEIITLKRGNRSTVMRSGQHLELLAIIDSEVKLIMFLTDFARAASLISMFASLSFFFHSMDKIEEE